MLTAAAVPYTSARLPRLAPGTVCSARSAHGGVLTGQRFDRIMLNHNGHRIPRPIPMGSQVAAGHAVDDWVERVHSGAAAALQPARTAMIVIGDRFTQDGTSRLRLCAPTV